LPITAWISLALCIVMKLLLKTVCEGEGQLGVVLVVRYNCKLQRYCSTISGHISDTLMLIEFQRWNMCPKQCVSKLPLFQNKITALNWVLMKFYIAVVQLYIISWLFKLNVLYMFVLLHLVVGLVFLDWPVL
jgi:hypothetical protein